MWKCPNAIASLNENQRHYCGEPQTVDSYIEEQPPEIRHILNNTGYPPKALPDAEERISWECRLPGKV